MGRTFVHACPKQGCGFSTEGRTAREATARMRRHVNRMDHATVARAFHRANPTGI